MDQLLVDRGEFAIRKCSAQSSVTWPSGNPTPSSLSRSALKLTMLFSGVLCIGSCEGEHAPAGTFDHLTAHY